MKNRGFSLIELLVVIASLSFLLFSFGYKYISKAHFSSRVARDQVIADIRYIQILAISLSEQKSIQFSIGSNEYIVDGEKKKLPDGINFATTTLPFHTLTYNSIGEPLFPDLNDRFIYFSDGEKIKIYALTGKVE